MEIKFLTMDEVLSIHRDQIQNYGGSEGIREPAMLESAIAIPNGVLWRRLSAS